jgi:hypothetical protein
MKLSKREEKYRIKIFQEYHFDKEGQKKVDCFILKHRRYDYEKLYYKLKNAANAIQNIAEALRGLATASVLAAQSMPKFAVKMDENTSCN